MIGAILGGGHGDESVAHEIVSQFGSRMTLEVDLAVLTHAGEAHSIWFGWNGEQLRRYIICLEKSLPEILTQFDIGHVFNDANLVQTANNPVSFQLKDLILSFF